MNGASIGVVSYPEFFAENYDRWAADMTEDVPFYVDLAREANGSVVELAVGTGRVAIPVAQAIGRKVIGIDSSPAMLEQARVAGGELLDLRLADIRDLALEGPAALIYCPARALLHLPTWADRRTVSNGSRARFSRAVASPGMHSHSTTRSRAGSTDCARRRHSPTRSATPSATAVWTSCSTTG
jgi:SAM-dependent methyltransferase